LIDIEAEKVNSEQRVPFQMSNGKSIGPLHCWCRSLARLAFDGNASCQIRKITTNPSLLSNLFPQIDHEHDRSGSGTVQRCMADMMIGRVGGLKESQLKYPIG
jgi:hypothetical protein